MKWKRANINPQKGDTNTPSNFRPITLENIPLKVFTSCLRNIMYLFLTVNNYVEQNIQKSFNPNISGTLEHNAQMANIINEASNKQCSLLTFQLDLKNAFGEAQHSFLITTISKIILN